MYDENALTEAKRGLRIIRDQYLQETDWAVLPDSPLNEEVKDALLVYRQYLRDLPSLLTDEQVMTFNVGMIEVTNPLT